MSIMATKEGSTQELKGVMCHRQASNKVTMRGGPLRYGWGVAAASAFDPDSIAEHQLSPSSVSVATSLVSVAEGPPFAYFCAFKPSCIVPVTAFPAQSVETDITSEEFERDRFGVLIQPSGKQLTVLDALPHLLRRRKDSVSWR